MNTTSAPPISVRGLRKQYGAVRAVDGVAFDVHEGEVFGLLGPNGAGKTTTIECVIGLRRPDEGEVRICGIDARARPRDARRHVGAALQATSLQDKVTPREALALFAALHDSAQPAPRAAELLDTFGLTDKADAPFDSLSGGQRQRLALALALVNRPDVVVLDEPTAGLDPASRRELHAAIARLRQGGRAVLFTTHLIAEAEQLCDRVAIIAKGHIVASGSPSELVARSRSAQRVSLTISRALPPDVFAALPATADVSVDDGQVRFTTSDAARSVAALGSLVAAHDCEIVELHVGRSSLEELFLELTGP